MNKNLTKWHKATQDLVEHFIATYFVDEDIPREDVEAFWVGDEIGGTLCIGDFFFDLRTIVLAIQLDCPMEKLFEWYNYTIENENNINLDHYLRMNDPKTNQEETK